MQIAISDGNVNVAVAAEPTLDCCFDLRMLADPASGLIRIDQKDTSRESFVMTFVVVACIVNLPL